MLNRNLNQINKSELKNFSSPRSTSSEHPFLLVIFGSIFLLIFITVMVVFIYRIIKKQYNQSHRKRSSRRRNKGRRNFIRDESTILHVQTDTI
jgi:hypothetical protein